MSIALEILDENLNPKTQYFSQEKYSDAIQTEMLKLKQKLWECTHQETWLRLERGNLEFLLSSKKLDEMEKPKGKTHSSQTLSTPIFSINDRARPSALNPFQSRFPQKLGDVKMAHERITKIINKTQALATTIQLLENQLRKLETLQGLQKPQLSNKLQEHSSEPIHAPRKLSPPAAVTPINLNGILNGNLHGNASYDQSENHDHSANAPIDIDSKSARENPSSNSGTPRIAGTAIISNSNSNSGTPRIGGLAIISNPDSATPRLKGVQSVTIQLPTKQGNVTQNDPAEKQPEIFDTTLIHFASFSTTVLFSTSSASTQPIRQDDSKHPSLKQPKAPPPTARSSDNARPQSPGTSFLRGAGKDDCSAMADPVKLQVEIERLKNLPVDPQETARIQQLCK